MIPYEEVLALRDALPPRQPRGDPRNIARVKTGCRWFKAIARYQREHGESWFVEMKRRRK